MQLEAFRAVAHTGNFSKAAVKLSITQSALSQRVLKLEQELETSLFLREANGIHLTETGERLLRSENTRQLLEEEFLSSILNATSGELSGLLKVAGFSTYVRSRLVPELGKFAQKYPNVSFEVLTREIRDLPHLLSSGAADFVISTQKMNKQTVECCLIDYEENVLIQASILKNNTQTYIDHDLFDTTTSDFWKIQKTRP